MLYDHFIVSYKSEHFINTVAWFFNFFIDLLVPNGFMLQLLFMYVWTAQYFQKLMNKIYKILNQHSACVFVKVGVDVGLDVDVAVDMWVCMCVVCVCVISLSVFSKS